MSAWKNLAADGTLARLPVERSSITITSWPAARYASAIWEAMNPAPPVSAIFIRASLPAEWRIGSPTPALDRRSRRL
jgi:hypothetical protein